MFKNLTKRAAIIMALSLSIAVGGVTTAAVMAAIPGSNGMISGCHNTLLGNLRAIDAEASGTCNGLETAVSWPAHDTGAKVAYVGFHENGTLDTTYSQGVDSFTLIPIDPNNPSNGFTVCLDLAFDPKWGEGETGAIGLATYVSTLAYEGDYITQTCGSGYNAASVNYGAMHTYRYAFYR